MWTLCCNYIYVLYPMLHILTCFVQNINNIAKICGVGFLQLCVGCGLVQFCSKFSFNSVSLHMKCKLKKLYLWKKELIGLKYLCLIKMFFAFNISVLCHFIQLCNFVSTHFLLSVMSFYLYLFLEMYPYVFLSVC